MIDSFNKQFRKAFNQSKAWALTNASKEVQEWLEEAENSVYVPFWPKEGFIKIGFVHAFQHLLAGTQYKEAIKYVLASP